MTAVTHEYPFLDKYLFFRWADDEAIPPGAPLPQPTTHDQYNAETELNDVLQYLNTVGPDALFRMVLMKPPFDRTDEELDLVYNELLHIRALSHLSCTVKREMAAIAHFEAHTHAGTVLFRQGDDAKCWYIILRGSVNVCIHNKGVVCALHEGDDFGKLALVSDAPRAATVVLREDSSHFLRIDKHDFNRILRDVDANTVRLREHRPDLEQMGLQQQYPRRRRGSVAAPAVVDVLVLEKVTLTNRFRRHHRRPIEQLHPHDIRYSVMAGTPEKMLEYLLETRVDVEPDERMRDTFYDDFILTHLIFIPTNVLGNLLKHYYQKGCSVHEHLDVGIQVNGVIDELQLLASKRRVVYFMYKWITMVGLAFFLDPVGNAFVEELYCAVAEDCGKFVGLDDLMSYMIDIVNAREGAMRICSRPSAVVLERAIYRDDAPAPEPVMSFDIAIIDVHSPVDGSYVPMKTRLDRTAEEIRNQAGARFVSGKAIEDMFLVEVKSNGEKVLYESNQVSIATMLGQNSRLFICFHDQIESLRPLPDQYVVSESMQNPALNLLSAVDIATEFVKLHWDLFSATHEFELLYYVIGRAKFPGRLPSNLDLLLRRFEEVKFWVTTEMLLCTNMNRRAQMLSKFIKIAQQCKAYQDLLAFFAIVLGLSNVAVGRLRLTWERLPVRLRRLFAEFESLLDPSRNHRTYRLLISDMQPPIVPFVPLLVKDLTFTHENNKTYFDGLVNFEKMHIISHTLRAFKRCKAEPFVPNEPLTQLNDAQKLLRNLRMIDNARVLMDLSLQLEPGQPY